MTINLTKISKVEFKKLHSSNKLLVIDAPLLNKEDTTAVLESKVEQGVTLKDHGRETTHASVDGKGTSVYYDRVSGILMAETLPVKGEWERNCSQEPKPQTAVYIVK